MFKKTITIMGVIGMILSTGGDSFANDNILLDLRTRDTNEIKQDLINIGTSDQYIDELAQSLKNNELPDCLNSNKKNNKELIEKIETSQKIEYVYEYEDGSISREGIDYSESTAIEINEDGTINARYTGTVVKPSPSSSSSYHTQYIGATAYGDTAYTMSQMKVDFTTVKSGAGHSYIERVYSGKSTGKLINTTSTTKNPSIIRKTATSSNPATATFEYKINNTAVKCILAFNVIGTTAKAAANEYTN